MIKIVKVKKNHYQIHTAYKLPDSLYRMTYYAIRYVYIEVMNIEKDISHDYGEVTKDETGNTATSRVFNEYVIKACDDAWSSIPKEYHQSVYDHIIKSTRYCDIMYSHENTLKRYTSQYIWFVAYNLGWI